MSHICPKNPHGHTIPSNKYMTFVDSTNPHEIVLDFECAACGMVGSTVVSVKTIAWAPVNDGQDRFQRMLNVSKVTGRMVDQAKHGRLSVGQLLHELRDAGLDSWDDVTDPEALFKELRGE